MKKETPTHFDRKSPMEGLVIVDCRNVFGEQSKESVDSSLGPSARIQKLRHKNSWTYFIRTRLQVRIATCFAGTKPGDTAGRGKLGVLHFVLL